MLAEYAWVLGISNGGSCGTHMDYREQQYDFLDQLERVQLGSMSSGTWQIDPKRLVFTLARYKFVAKMLHGRSRVLEVGCGDGWASRIVLQNVNELVLSDFDPKFISEVNSRNHSFDGRHIETLVLDPLQSLPPKRTYDGIYALDVLEHIHPRYEDQFMTSICAGLVDFGTVIIGMPSLESQKYASAASIAGHVNCKSQEDFRQLMEKYFETVFMFSMSDEVVHTGFGPMANYLLGLGVQSRVH